MINLANLPLNELLIAKYMNISNYENKSKEDLIKALSETKPETKTEQTPKPEKPEKPEPEPKLEIRVNKRKLKNYRKDFYELRNKFSKKQKKEYRKAFYIAKSYKRLSDSEIENINKNFNELKKIKFKKVSW